jgi:cytochrome c peroxidase
VTCLDCHVNGHTTAQFHLNPDDRPQQRRFRLDTVSLRGLYNQQIHGSKRSLRSVEDFTEFEQRAAYFDGDPVLATKKGVNPLDRGLQVQHMSEFQKLLDFPPSKVGVDGRLDPAVATDAELRGQAVFFGQGQCADCHTGAFFTDSLMHDLKVERFFEPRMINGIRASADGPIKTFTLRGLKDSPPYFHDGRLLTIEDTVEFFNLVLQTKLTTQEKADLVAFLTAL